MLDLGARQRVEPPSWQECHARGMTAAEAAAARGVSTAAARSWASANKVQWRAAETSEARNARLADARKRIVHHKKVSDEALRDAYARHGNIWKVGEEVGLCGQSVHERLKKMGIAKSVNVFTEIEIERLREEYWIAAEAGKLADLAADMGRTKQIICRQARAMGLTKRDRRKPYGAVWKYVSEDHARAVWEKFKASSLNLGQYCAKQGYDDLGFSKCMKRYFADEWEHVIELKQSSQTHYRIGRQFEYRVRDKLRELGYFAQRSPASKTPVDITSIGRGAVLLVQCKRGGSIGVAEWNTLFDLARSCGARPILAAMPKGRGIDFYEMTDRKDGSKRRQPMVPFDPASALETTVIVEELA